MGCCVLYLCVVGGPCTIVYCVRLCACDVRSLLENPALSIRDLMEAGTAVHQTRQSLAGATVIDVVGMVQVRLRYSSFNDAYAC